MKNLLRMERWSPYLVGAGLGLLGAGSLALLRQPLVTSGSFSRVASVAASWFVSLAPDSYFQQYTSEIFFNWQMMFVIGIFLGSVLSAALAYSWYYEEVSSIWTKNFGSSSRLRHSAAFGGGVLVMFGARLAGGCPTGQIFSGGMQLAASSFVFLITTFAVGIVVARLLYRRF